MSELPEKVAFGISTAKALGAVAFWVLFVGAGISIFLPGGEEGRSIVGVIGVGLIGIWNIYDTVKDAFERPKLVLHKKGFEFGPDSYNWSEVQTCYGNKTRTHRFISVGFEGKGDEAAYSLKNRRHLQSEDLPDRPIYRIDVSLFRASNRKIEDAIRKYWSAAHGLPLNNDRQ
ncbi:MAG: hypothetical protein EP335_09605 [Alphaproteobacteria bacterium]|nr:MAG: hypothetical protein EP335_09605 [Alphaproteobacteria bacterium]